MPQENLYPEILNLDQIDVFHEDDSNNPQFFQIKKLPSILSYGKHLFSISYSDPDGLEYRLKESSNVLFEFKDSNGNVIFSNLTEYNDIDGAALGYVWVKKDPLRISEEISDGIGTLSIVGELEGVPSQWEGNYNLRLTIPIEVRKNNQNLSPILFQSPGTIQSNINVSESIEREADTDTIKRSYLNISASHLKTYSGQVNWIDVFYNENNSSTEEFDTLTSYPITGSPWELPYSQSNGLSPISNLFKVPLPSEIRPNETLYFKLKFRNSEGQLAQDVVNNKDFEISSSGVIFSGSDFVIEKTLLISGSFFIGDEANTADSYQMQYNRSDKTLSFKTGSDEIKLAPDTLTFTKGGTTETLTADNVTNLKAGVAIGGTSQILSSSISGRLTVSQSAIISGSTTDGTVTNGLVVEGNVSASGAFLGTFSGSVSASSIRSEGKGYFGDDVTVNGNLTATTFTTQEIAADFSSGSTIFGNTDDDIHRFTGSLNIIHTGSNTGLYISGSAIRVTGDITASRMIVGTSDMTGVGGPYGNLYVKSDENNHAITLEDNDGNETYNIGVADSGQFQIYNSNSTTANFVVSDNNRVGIGLTNPSTTLEVRGNAIISSSNFKGHITASGNISSSTTSTGSFGSIHATEKVGIGTLTPEAGREGHSGLTIFNHTTMGSQTDFTQARISSSFMIKAGNNDFLAFDSNEIIEYGDNLYFGVLGDTPDKGNIYIRAGLSGSSNHATRMYISSSGKVGIGTTSPGTSLHISADGSSTLPTFNASTRLALTQTDNTSGFNAMTILGGHSTGASIYKFGDKDNEQIGMIKYLHTNDAMAFVTNTNEQMRIDSSGNVGIGTSSPLAELQVIGSISASQDLTIGRYLYIKDFDTGTSNDALISRDNNIQIWNAGLATGNFVDGKAPLEGAGNISADGNISASGWLKIKGGDTGNPSITSAAGDLVLKAGGDDVILQTGGGGSETIQLVDSAGLLHFVADMENTIFSGSANSTASFGLYKGDGSGLTGITAEWDGTHNADGHITGSLVVTNHITASNISASGTGSFQHLITTAGGVGNPAARFIGTNPSIKIEDSDNSLVGTVSVPGTSMNIGISGDKQIKFEQAGVPKFILGVGGHITASGNISASGDIYANDITGSGLLIGEKSGRHINLDDTGNLEISGGYAWIKTDDYGGESKLYLSSNVSNGGKLFYISAEDASDDQMEFNIGRWTHKWQFKGGGNTNAEHNVFEIYGIDSTDEADYSRLRLFSPDGTTRAQIHTSGSVYFNPEGPDANFGIGTTAPTKKLEVEGDISASGQLFLTDGNIRSDNHIDFVTLGGAANHINVGKLGMSASYSGANTAVDSLASYNPYNHQAAVFGGDVAIGPHNNGRLGIGILFPTEKLQVEGNISASGDLFLEKDKNIYFGYNEDSPVGQTSIFGDGNQLKLLADTNVSLQPDDDVIITTGANTEWARFDGSETQLRIGGSISASGHLYLEDGKGLYFANDGATWISGSDGGNDLWLRAADDMVLNPSDDLTIRNSDGEWARFDGGNERLGIGTDNPSQKLEVRGVIAASGSTAGLQIGRGGYDTFRFRQSSGTGLELYNQTDGRVEMKVQNGLIGLGTNSPQYTLQLSSSTDDYIDIKTSSHTGKVGLKLTTVRSGSGYGDSEFYKQGAQTYIHTDEALYFQSNNKKTGYIWNYGFAVLSGSAADPGSHNTFYVNTRRNRVSINGSNTNPDYTLDIRVPSTMAGYDGISMASASLYLGGDGSSGNTASEILFGKGNSNYIGAAIKAVQSTSDTDTRDLKFYVRGPVASDDLTEAIIIRGDTATSLGDVGIGITPTTRFQVDGTISGSIISSSHGSYMIGDKVFISGSSTTTGSFGLGNFEAIKVEHAVDGITPSIFGGNISGSATSTGSFAKLMLTDAGTSTYRGFDLNNRITMRSDGVLNWGSAAAHGTLTWDGSPNRAKVGGLSGYGLDLLSNGSTVITITGSSNRVGIGTASPGALVHFYYTDNTTNLKDNMALPLGNERAGLLIENANGTDGSYAALDFRSGDADGRILYKQVGPSNVGDFHFILDAGGAKEDRMMISASGNVGIGTSTPDYKLQVAGDIVPESDNSADLGTSALRWQDVYSVSTTTGGVFEVGLQTKGLKELKTGTIVVWKDGKCVPCYQEGDELVMGVTKEGKDEPIVLGAEPILVTGDVDEGDYIITSDKEGHGKAVKRGYLFKKDLFGKVIAQALESCKGESNIIKCMIRKM